MSFTPFRLAPRALALFVIVAPAAQATGLQVHVQDNGGKPLADVVVYAEPEAGQTVPKVMHAAEIEQRGLKFLPLVSVVQTGSRIGFPNNDKVRHHIYSFSPAKKFDQKLYSGVTATPQVFDKAGTVVLGCNIHDKMVAYVKVVDTPYFGKTDASGVAKFDLPAGKYTVKAWHYHMLAAAPAEQAMVVKAGDASTEGNFKLPLKPPVAESDSSYDPNY